ncbi:Sec63 Brl domain-containing protein [Aspergillus filifer]
MARRVDKPFIIPRRQGTAGAGNPPRKRGGRPFSTQAGFPGSSQSNSNSNSMSTGFIDEKLIQGSQTQTQAQTQNQAQSQVSPLFSRFTRREPREQETAYCAGGPGAPSQSYSQSLTQGHSQLGFPGLGTQPVEEFEDGEYGDVQLDAFDLELLAHPNDVPNRYNPPASSSAEYFPSYQPQQAEPSSQVSHFFSGPQVTPHRSIASSSSDIDARDASSPLARLYPGKGGGMLRGLDYKTQSPITQAFRSQSAIDPPRQDQDTPFPDIPVSIRGVVLISVRELPDNYRSLFNFPVFNAVQSKCFQNVYKGDDNVVLAAPTGSGKTVVMELAICRLKNTLKDDQFKIVYQAPTKSLCSERFRDWSRKFQTLNLQCAELTGDTDPSSLRNVQNSQIIITTPEKWDSMTRKWKDHARLMQLVKLFLIDEVHTLKEARGATLEAVVSRMKSIGSNVRFVALSATIPNSEDIATWLGRNATSQHVPAHREHFGEEFRPVKLQKFVYGHQSHLNDFAFDKFLNSKLAEVIGTHSAKKPIMIFCCTRNSAVTTAKELAKLWSMSNHPARLWRGPNTQMPVTNTDLKTTTIAGVAFHHAGLDPSDRRQVETGYIAGKLSIICCTSTLAVGVNLPCHLVIIKNTVGWQDGCCQEYSDLEVMQMLGRAGRPQFDESATAVILTRKNRVDHYEKLVSGSEGLESCLHLNLIEHLNAEIGLGNINSLETATGWLAGTFLFVRLRRNPTHYKLKEGANRDDEDEMLRQICEKDIKLLQEYDLVESNSLKSTPLGDAMARYYIRFETMKTIHAMKPQSDVAQILSTMSQAEEFREVRLKAGERSVYKALNRSSDIKYPINVDIALPCHKISLIIQSELGAVEFPNAEQFQKYKFAFQQDRNFVFSHVNRVIRCIIDCQVHLEDSVTTRNALELARSLAARVWDDSPLQMKQIEQIGIVAVRKLAAAGIDSIEALEETEPHQIDMALSKNPPFGMKLRSRLAEFPKLRVAVKMAGKDIKPGRSVKVRFKAEIAFMNKECPLFFQKRPVYVCFIAETSDGRLIDFRRISAHRLKANHEVFLTAELKACDQSISCHVMCDEIAGTSRYARLEPNIPLSCFPKSDEGTGALLADEGQGGVAREPCDGKSSSKIDETNLDQYDIDDLLFGEWLDPEIMDDWNEESRRSRITEPPKCTAPHRPISRSNQNDSDDKEPIIGAADRDFQQQGSTQISEIFDDWDEKSVGLDFQEAIEDTRVPNNGAPRKEGARLDKATERNSNIDREPEKLENGRWACNHKCKDKTSCKHLCCREGLTNPPKPPRKKLDEAHFERTESKQLKLSASITKPKDSDGTPAIDSGSTRPQSKNTHGLSSSTWALVQQLPGSKNVIGESVSLAADFSSDYGDESFDGFPSPLAALLGDSESSLEHLPQAKSDGDQADTGGPRQEHGWTHVDEGPFRAQLLNDELAKACLVDLVSSESQELSSPSPGVGKAWSKKRALEDGVGSGEHDQANNDSRKRLRSGKAEPEAEVEPRNQGEDNAADERISETQTSPILDVPPVPTDWEGIDPALLEDFKDIVDFF